MRLATPADEITDRDRVLDELLSILLPGRDGILDSYSLAACLGVNQRAIGSLVNELRQRGHLVGSAHGRGYYLIQSDAGTISVSIFDDESSAKESNEAAASWLGENMPGVSASNIAGGEVLLSF